MSKNSNSKWTSEEDDRLLDLMGSNRSYIRIAAALGRSVKAVRARYLVIKRSELPVAGNSATNLT
jgi:hypothetical protein